MEYILSLHPKYLGRRLQKTIKNELYNEVEGKYFSGIGYVLLVLSTPSDVGIGLVDPNNGFAEFKIKYTALVYAPVINEVTYCIVTKVTPVLLYVLYIIYQHALLCKFGPADGITVMRISFLYFISFLYYSFFYFVKE